MNVAVLTLTRDRLDYTKHCFASLRENAGIDFDHFVFDNGSEDGTLEWLRDQYDARLIASVKSSPVNRGIYEPLNNLLDDTRGYDVVVNFDNDCEVVTPGTLRAVAEVAVSHPGSIIGPRVQGLRNPPRIASETTVDEWRVGVTQQIGGIFMPIPAGWRYSESGRYVHADGLVCADALAHGRMVGYLLDYTVNHYETTDGQHARYPAYFARRVAEGIPD